MQLLKSITLENFRIFRNSHKIVLKPITVLIGPNSSGKSSVIKSLILGKNNSANGLQNLDFTGPKHNLGTFLNATNNQAKSIYLSLGFEFDFSLKENEIINRFISEVAIQEVKSLTSTGNFKRLLADKKHKKTNIYVKLTYIPNQGSGELTLVEYYSENEKIPFIKFMLNDGESTNHNLIVDFDQIKNNPILNHVFIEQANKFINLNLNSNTKKSGKNNSQISGIHTFRVSTDEYSHVNQKSPIDICKDLYNQMIKSVWNVENDKGYASYLSKHLSNILPDYLGLILENSDFIEAIRANTRRIYTNDSQGSSFNELILEYKSRKISEYQITFINKWLKNFEIADEILFENIEGVATSIFLKRNDKKTALVDLGFGVTQILPLIMKISMESPRLIKNNELHEIVDKVLMLEEPETNLHPKLQSVLADFLNDATKTFAVQFIIETHSEYLIRKLQILVAQKKLVNDEVIIYYFNPEEDENGKVTKEITISENGSLTDDFGPGFFDEAASLQIELMKLKRSLNE